MRQSQETQESHAAAASRGSGSLAECRCVRNQRPTSRHAARSRSAASRCCPSLPAPSNEALCFLHHPSAFTSRR
jgi:hypothetical protein